MSKTVLIKLGSGNLYNGLPRVTAQMWAVGQHQPEQFVGGLPAAPYLVELYRNWQSVYQNLSVRRQMLFRIDLEEDDQLEIDSTGITNVSVVSFDELCQKLYQSINAWLKSFEFLNIDQQLRTQLEPAEEIRVIIETSDQLLQQLPWHRWDFFKDYPNAEMALSRPEYKRVMLSRPKTRREKVRILAILGNSKGIDLEAETRFLESLQDAEVNFLVKPSRQEFNTQLWDAAGWDILFFAGHSQTEGETGRIYINENKTNGSLTIEQLEEALKTAIANGLRLAIFNSCDGLGLALALERLSIPTVIAMREPVPNRVAQDFFKHFLGAFAIERLPLYLSVQQARRKLQGVEDDFPAASWLPAICQNPAAEPPTWLALGGIPPCPYRGLFTFQEEDAHLFFGREQFTQDLMVAVKKKSLVAVVGASGSGKSSVVFAGLIPRLRQEAFVVWQIVSFRPGNSPFEALAAAIAPLWKHQQDEHACCCLKPELSSAGSFANALRQDHNLLYKIIESFVQTNPGTRLLLIADQFEELYTQSLELEHQPFLDGLLTAVRLAPAFSLVLTLRADFYGHALSYRPFSDALQGAIQNLGPMSRQELHSAIEEPAAQMQVSLEDGLTNKLINEAWGQPGRLPLLEFALTTLWSKHQNGLLTNQAYKAIGGVEEALANHAESIYAQMSEADRCRAQRVFIQLVQPGIGTDAHRRLATPDEVKQDNWDLVTQLASVRLVVTSCNEFTGEETVEIVHEALIKSWGRLEQWMQVDGEFRLWQEHLRAAMRQWESSGKDEGALLRGKPLADAQYWHLRRLEELSSGERSFILLCLELQERELQKQKLRQQLTLFGLISGLVITSILTGVAWWQWHHSAHSEIKAINESSVALFASNNRLDALIEAIKAKQKLQKLDWADASTQTQVEAALRQAIYGAVECNRLLGHDDWVWGVVFSPNGETIASASSDKTVKLWKKDGTLLATLKGHSAEVYGVAFSPDGQMIASGSRDKTVKLWKKDGTLLATLKGHSATVRGVAFSPDSQMIASGSEDKTIKLWERDGTEIATLQGHSDLIYGVAFSPDSQLIASASMDKTVKLWKKDGTLLATLNGHSAAVSAVAFSPDSGLIASASWDKSVKLWNRDGTFLKTLNGHSDEVWGVFFSPDGQLLASASGDKTIKLWRRNSSLMTPLSHHSDEVRGVAFSPDGQLIASSSRDKTVKLWKKDGTELATLKGHSDLVYGVAFSPNGQLIASSSWDKTVKLWKKDGTLLTTLQGHSDLVYGVAFSPDGQLIASASSDKTVKLWRKDGTLLTTLQGHGAEVWGVAFSPDSQMVASGSRDKTVKLWRKDGTLLATLKGHKAAVNAVAFSPDGQLIASGSWDKTVRLWRRDGTWLATLNHGDEVWGVAFSPDSQLIASGSRDNKVKLWKNNSTLVTTINGHSAGVSAVAFSPDGKILASASLDNMAILWNLNRVLALDQLMVYGCDWVRDYLRTSRGVEKSDRHLCDHIGSQEHKSTNLRKIIPQRGA